MVRKVNKYVDILRIELNDLINEINEHVETSHQEHNDRVIKNFTYHGNLTIYEKQLEGIKQTAKLLEEMDLSDYESINDLAKDLTERMKSYFTTRGLLEGGYHLTLKRVEGARDYVLRTERNTKYSA
ncbi:hypothetical protein [Anaerocolumna xylanovorans]|uniref:Uncharacterized protein n=1 Tax=Anaerocolumna xylanovorans DSM 12503 TaxID=1121345 RepID=A0A1M7YL85_9FIRM|nr:hypothetical protein [Anaerocolumna xylanovorans]SHO53352.1 hypothetical protein SAMN02745217_04077 [Anaerocolumna xylanovorans DSM 12503]